MPDLETGRHRLPLLAVSQAQKEVTHNEALVLIDALIQLTVESTQSKPPEVNDTEIGRCWLVGAAPSGLWVNKVGHIAIWTGGSWRFSAPQTGMRLWDKSIGRQSHYNAGQWISGPSISSPVGGTCIDVEAREALASILQFLRSIGMCAS